MPEPECKLRWFKYKNGERELQYYWYTTVDGTEVWMPVEEVTEE